MKRLSGLGVAMITPFNDDGTVDYNSLDSLTEQLVKHDVDFLCVLGTTAETPTLTDEEKRVIRQRTIAKNHGRLPILLGVSSNCTRCVVDTLRNEDLTGVDAVLVAVPYYNKPSQEGIYQHYKAIAEATSLPVVMYNVPGRTGVNMTAETTLRLARDCANIVAIKEASGNKEQILEIVAKKPYGFDVLSGDDSLTFELMQQGVKGVVSVLGNAYPKEFAEMVHLLQQGQVTEARNWHEKFDTLYSLLFVDGNPSGVKALMSLQAKVRNVLRLPLVPARATTTESLSKEMKNIGM
ncbi:MAG: 4-hydroxy-tetrahydrodipicolinate synthase [Bacteroidales bacterium]|nr:4-hydroxy-tetrahydrodipicolinate synthase [Bacteroidales bacterium]